MPFDPLEDRLRLQWHPRTPDTMRPSRLHHQRRDGGMKMEMLVGIDMIQLQAGGGESLELRFDLGGKLCPHLG